MPSRKGRKTASGRKAAKKAGKAAATVAKRLARKPTRRTVAKAAVKVQKGAGRARKVGDAVVTAGEIIKQGADLAESLAVRVKSRTKR